jgi:hypothetical protein
VIINAHNFGGSWTPAQISTALWLDAADSSTLFDATSGGSLVAADGAIARWEDKSGNTRHFTQATSGSRPQRKTAIQNARDVLRLDGTADFLEQAFSAWGTSYSVVLVGKPTSVASASALFSARSKTLANPVNAQISHASSVSQHVVRDNAGSLNNSTIASLSNSTWYLFGAHRSGNNVTAYRDGTAGTTQTNAIGTLTTTASSVGASFPGSATASSFFAGDIAEIVICGVSDREIVEGYVAHKWGLAASLPALHPYKSVAP